MKLTNQQIIGLSDAITRLDGQHVLVLAEGKAVNVFRSYRVAAPARWLLARAQGALQLAIADFNRAKDALINHHSNGTGELKQGQPALKLFLEDLDKLKAQPVELGLEQIGLEQLHLEANETAGAGVPIAVLTALSPLIKQA